MGVVDPSVGMVPKMAMAVRCSAASPQVAAPPRTQVEKRDKAAVDALLKKYPYLGKQIPIAATLSERFFPGSTLVLETLDDEDDGDAEPQLFLVIRTKLDVDAAQLAFHNLVDMWLEKLDKDTSLLAFSLEHV